MRFWILPLLLIFLASLTVTQAAPADEKWYFAQDIENGLITAYTPAGESNLILEGGFSERAYANRLDDQSMLITLIVDGNNTLYHLTPDSATPITTPVDLNPVTGGFFLRDFSYPYAVLQVPGDTSVITALLVNLDTHTAEILTPNVVLFNGNTLVFSQEGEFLRYIRQNGDSTWEIVERTLATASEQVIFTIQNQRFPTLMADVFGENWLFFSRVDDSTVPTLIKADGTTETFPASNSLWSPIGDNIVITPAICQADCPIEVRTFDQTTQATFTLPVRDSYVYAVTQPDDSQIILVDTGINAYYQLGADNFAHLIGYWSPQIVFTPIQDVLSPDGRYLLTITSEESPIGYSVWDTESQTYILQNTFKESGFNFVQITYSDMGFIIWENSQDAFAYFDGQITELPGADTGHYFDLFADGTLLYFQYGLEGAPNPQGIYRYDPSTDTYTRLVENGEPL